MPLSIPSDFPTGISCRIDHSLGLSLNGVPNYGPGR